MASVDSVGGNRQFPGFRPRLLTIQDALTLPPPAVKSAPMGSTVKFDIPLSCRDFSPFARLPAEIRHQIWENTLATPGMHLLKIQSEDKSSPGKWWAKSLGPPHASAVPSDSSSDDEKELDHLTLEIQRETSFTSAVSAHLSPLYPTPQADVSYHTTLNQELTKFSVTCNESAAVVKRLLSRPAALKLDGGRMISLDISSDIIYLEYVPPDIFEDNFRFTKSLRCAGLEKIRNVAVRFCHKWHEKHSPTRCSVCGQIHHAPDKIAYPNHLYQFLTQYLPNLERFYFVDYFILRKNVCETGDGQANAKPSVAKFEGGNRTYYEVDDQSWNIKSNVFDTMSWLQDRFVRYAKESKLSNHKNPDQVKFGVLACEWTVGQDIGIKKTASTPTKKGRNKRAFCEEHGTWRGRRPSHQMMPTPAPDHASFKPEGTFPFVFGVAGKNHHDFTFSVSRR